ncbi:helix-turn-helix domain-containing protein [Aquimarina sediminis]|uniref:helix-turn-helix domain-containing protein n=1 Tax=Aquimarina sediminis TaxID=2070536 RepID=UPI001F4E0407|nr:helix-turn-helix domain-containing protein [Aquimarina sediminis]
MKKVLIKNMVCDRCTSVLQQEFQKSGIPVKTIKLGQIIFEDIEIIDFQKVEEIITRNGFEIIHDESDLIVEQIKSYLITLVSDEKRHNQKLSDLVSKHINKEYSIISKLFSNNQGITIEKYFIRLKIEKAKELIQMGNLSFSEISYSLDYKSGSHLAKQFKTITGISMSDYKNLQSWDRQPLDKIV